MPETVVFSDAYVWTFLAQLAILFIAILVGNVPYPEKRTPGARLNRAVAFMREFERVMAGREGHT